MSSTEERLSWAAIILSGAAFIISIGQALQQYLATAEGYRRCSKRVLGPWKKYTHRILNAKELRFETWFATPLISLEPLFDTDDLFHATADFRPLHGANETGKKGAREGSEEASENGNSPDEAQSDELVPLLRKFGSKEKKEWACWLRMLAEVKAFHKGLLETLPTEKNRVEQALRTGSQGSVRSQALAHARPCSDPEKLGNGRKATFSFPGFEIERHSWDFVPSDVLKPLAKIGISDLAICMRRLGLKWVHFQPMDFNLRAEGYNVSLTSFYLRAVGCVVTYTRVRGSIRDDQDGFKRYYIPCMQADAMGFGLLPSCHENAQPFFDVSSTDKVLDLFEEFDCVDLEQKASKRLRSLVHRDSLLYSFTDLIPLTAPFMRRKGSTIVRIPAPMPRAEWLFYSNTGRQAYYYALQHEAQSWQEPARDVLLQAAARYKEILSRDSSLGAATKAQRLRMDDNMACVQLLDGIQEEFDDIQRFFGEKAETVSTAQALQVTHGDLSDGTNPPTAPKYRFGGSKLYSALVTVHVRHAVLADQYSEEKLNGQNGRTRYEGYPSHLNSPASWNQRLSETLRQYTCRWKYMHPELNKLGYTFSEADFLELWTRMMLRGFCWQWCHRMIDDPRVPAEYWNSRTPIYIG